ncbi:MAG: SDR family oxidoreductase [Sandaracinaceae bacterium]|nr:SDR family oxidoreductase [Sandaracinaceae bacterium]
MTTSPRVFVTGGTGLIGRFTIEALLRRGAHVTMMVRPSSLGARAARIEALHEVSRRSARGGTLSVVQGDLDDTSLGLDEAGRTALLAADHVFHLAALYDISADEAALVAANEAGTRHLLTALSGFRGVLHHVSSIAVAGDYQGTFTESMFDEGQSFPHAYHRSKFNSEKQVRAAGLAHRIYRPSAVVGHSVTGEMDRVDGPYLGFAGLQQLAGALPRWVKLPVPKVRGRMNLVPVDYVANALAHIGLAASASDVSANGRVHHLVDPAPPRFAAMLGIFLREMHGPGLGVQVDVRGIPGVDNALNLMNMLPSVATLRRDVLDDLGLPPDGHRRAQPARALRRPDDAGRARRERHRVPTPGRLRAADGALLRRPPDRCAPAAHALCAGTRRQGGAGHGSVARHRRRGGTTGRTRRRRAGAGGAQRRCPR